VKLNKSNFNKIELNLFKIVIEKNIRFLNRGRCSTNQFGYNDNCPGFTTETIQSLVKKGVFKAEFTKSKNIPGDNKYIICVSIPIMAITNLINNDISIVIDEKLHYDGVSNHWQFY